MLIELTNKNNRYTKNEIGCSILNPYVETHYIDIESQVLFISQEKARELYVTKDSMGTELRPNDTVLRIFLKSGVTEIDDTLKVFKTKYDAYVDLKAADYFINFIG